MIEHKISTFVLKEQGSFVLFRPFEALRSGRNPSLNIPLKIRGIKGVMIAAEHLFVTPLAPLILRGEIF